MTFVIDVGNTNIKLGIYKGEKLVFKSTISTNRQKTADEYAVDLYSVFRVYGFEKDEIKGSILSCVVPTVTKPVAQAVEMITGKVPIIVGPGIKTGLNIKTNNPAVLGGDLVVGLVAAAEVSECPCILFNLGTATTIFVLDETKTVIGGSILPGVAISHEALINRCDLLPSVSFEAPNHVVGKSTDECIRSGVVLGNAAMIDGMIDRIEEEIGQECDVIATGGMSRIVVPNCKRKIRIMDNLLLDGLKLVYDRNQKTK